MGTEAEEPVRDASKSLARLTGGFSWTVTGSTSWRSSSPASSVFLILDLRGTFRCGTCNPVLRLQRADKRQPHAHHRRRRYQPATPLPRVPLTGRTRITDRGRRRVPRRPRGDDRRGGADNAPEFLRVPVESTRRQAQELDDMAVNETTEEVRDDVAPIVSELTAQADHVVDLVRESETSTFEALAATLDRLRPQINRLRQIQYRYADELPADPTIHRRTRPPAERRGHRASVLQDPLPPGRNWRRCPGTSSTWGSPRWSSS